MPFAPPPPPLPVPDLVFTEAGELVPTSERGLRRFQRRSFSVSAASNMAKCPASWAGGYVVPETDDPFRPNVLGTGGHSVLERLLQLPAHERTLERALALLDDVAAEQWQTRTCVPGERGQQEWRAEVERGVRGYFALEDPQHVDVHATEQRVRGLALPNGVALNGDIDRVDAVSRNQDGSVNAVAIVDYKFGKYRAPDPRFGRTVYEDQVRIYAVAAALHLGVPMPTSGTLLYPAAGVPHRVDLSAPEIDAALDWHADAWGQYQRSFARGAFPTRPSALCGWCPLARVCPVAQLTSKKARDYAAANARSRAELGIPVVPAATLRERARSGAAVRRIEPAATAKGREHMTDTTTAQVPTTAPVPAPRTLRPEADPRHVLVRDSAGTDVLNLNSWASIGAYGIAAWAYELLRAREIAPKGDEVLALATLLSDVVLAAQEEHTGHRNWQAGANTRLRGLLRSYVAERPVPFGEGAEAIAEWRRAALAGIVFLAKVGDWLARDDAQLQPGDLDTLGAIAATPF